ncbi:hypothetical protein HY311_03775 [Candidatus Nomurabacteria bacterium]|nr:hypothetical protein [Candidatus Nomurabacteria bacterium]
MQNRVIMVSSVNLPDEAAQQMNDEIKKLGEGWSVVDISTNVEVFGVVVDGINIPPLHHAVYAITVALQKPDFEEVD